MNNAWKPPGIIETMVAWLMWTVAFSGVAATPTDALMSQLTKAVIRGDLAAVKLLLANKPDVNQTRSSGATLLMDAAYHGHLPVVEQLLAAGANPIARTKEGWTALMAAARQGHLDIVKRLVQQGATVDAKKTVGTTG
jgi:ankyrin repeat protein